jgi:hypothetical protein
VGQVAQRSLRQRTPSRRFSVFVICAAAALLAPGASGSPNVPGDPTPPVVTRITSGTLGSNGWYVTNVTVNWRVEDPESIILETRGCDSTTLTAETRGTPLSCYARSDGGETTNRFTYTIDKTAPTVTAGADRPPDASDWYNHPLTASFSGTDAMAGVAACSSGGYGGPDAATASIAGTCRDNAGNLGQGVFSFKYDATAPTVGALSVKPGNRVAHLTWSASADTVQVDVLRSPGVKGERESLLSHPTGTSYRDKGLTPGRKYRYTVAVHDQAANRAAQAIDFVGRGPLLNPAPGQEVKSAPFLTWTPVKGASYYNVVLVRARRVFSAWPRQPRLQLPRSWTYRGRRQRLRPGVYRWYVWPGFGRLSAGRYGRLLGGSTFVVTG